MKAPVPSPFDEYFKIEDYKEYMTREMNTVLLIYNYSRESLIVNINGVKVDEIENIKMQGDDLINNESFRIPGHAMKYKGDPHNN